MAYKLNPFTGLLDTVADWKQYFWNNKLITEDIVTADNQNQIMIWDIELDTDVTITVGDGSDLNII